MTSPWARAIRCVTRKPGRTLLMTLIMTVVFTALVAQSGVRSTMTEVKNAINTNVGAGFTATGAGSAGETADEVEAGSDEAPREVPRESTGRWPSVWQPCPQVARHSLEAAALARPKGAQPVLGASGVQLDPQFAGDVSVPGTSDSSLNPAFQGKLCKLVEGEHVGAGESRAGADSGSKAGVGKANIHREFADHNNLGVGGGQADSHPRW
ncbi:hypothetical protein [Brevibacterium sp. HMSC063G07]|uniref:hypothetical protein n=1 Tax=Brevibacterium sp. HMSC063G07 TaxID=1739261 RepID=UPI0008B8A64A|nr:hypothetical protein [Brevibacterium sp. HMSC063G07]OFL67608.1 hypothetical protein HMPREF2757_10100 [Brevibacterium sp. HMSC063G07]